MGLTTFDLARSMPIGLMRFHTRGRYETPPHVLAINNLVLDLASRTTRRAIVIAPPRHAKTETAMYGMAWWLGNWPTQHVMYASYEAGVARSKGRKARDVLEEVGPALWGVHVRDDVRAANDWETVQGGGLVTAGRGGPLTARGADLAIVDDLFKNAKEAESPTIQEEAWDWFRSTLLPRLSPDGVVLVLNARWTELDLVGRILADPELANTYVVLRYPALAEDDDPLGRKPGDALWPERYPAEVLLAKRAEVGPYWWAGQWQGRPSPVTGAMFKRDRFRYWDWQDAEHTVFALHDVAGDRLVPYEACEVVAFMDTASTEEPRGDDSDPDWTVISVWALTPEADMILLDVWRVRVESTNHEQMVREVYRRWRCVVHVEEQFLGTALIQGAKRTGLPIQGVRADRNKVMRARALEARYALLKVFHPTRAAWLEDWEAELLTFPKGRHDDMTDTGSYAAAHLANRVEVRIRSLE